MNDKKKMIVIGVLGALLFGVGAFQFVQMGASNEPAAKKSVAPKEAAKKGAAQQVASEEARPAEEKPPEQRPTESRAEPDDKARPQRPRKRIRIEPQSDSGGPSFVIGDE